MRRNPRRAAQGFLPTEFVIFLLADASVWRMIVFIVRRLLRLTGFLGIRRIAYEFYCPYSGRLLTEHGCILLLFSISAL